MIDITHKSSTLRKAVATARLNVSSPETIAAILERRVPKGDVFELSRAAGLFAVKRTSDVIPDCHPLPVEFTGITHRVEGLGIDIRVEVHTIYKTGVEVEAMHGASVVALTMYDMLKPLDKGIEIARIKLESKSGGKSDRKIDASGLRAAVVVCSDTISRGEGEDKAGAAIADALVKHGVSAPSLEIVPDDVERISQTARRHAESGTDLLIFTGGTGLSPRDVTPDALTPLFDREIPGIMEAARAYGQARTPYAMLSRGVSGFMGEMLVLALPGSTKGAKESMAALLPQILHLFRVREGKRHD